MDFLKRALFPARLKTPIPISTVIQGVEVAGEITYLAPNDMSVVILSPVSGLGTSLHVPYFAMERINWLATHEMIDGEKVAVLTERGRERAAGLLKELYDYAGGRPSGWGISRIETDGRWVDL